MRILGIDPGYAIVGYGILDYSANRFEVVGFGAITTAADMSFTKRLEVIYNDMCRILDLYKPDEMGIEKLFFNTNQKTGIDVAQARGVTILPAIQRNIPIYEYTPLQVKSSIVGYGRAEKKQVIDMVKRILRMKTAPKPGDAADAVAIALCHARSASSLLNINRGTEKCSTT